jgi:hypothetical protein
MIVNVLKEVAALQRMTVKELLVRYAEVFGEATRTKNRPWLVRRIAWRLQAKAEGGLTERALKRAEELADDADLRTTPPKETAATAPRIAKGTLATDRDDRLPPPGSVIVRSYKGRELKVKVLGDGFEFDGEVYPSLSAVAKAVTGSHCNGFLFFKLTKEAAA